MSSIQLTDTKNLSLGSLIGVLVTIFGALSEPNVLAILPAKIAASVIIAGAIITAVSKALVHDVTPQ